MVKKKSVLVMDWTLKLARPNSRQMEEMLGGGTPAIIRQADGVTWFLGIKNLLNARPRADGVVTGQIAANGGKVYGALTPVDLDGKHVVECILVDLADDTTLEVVDGRALMQGPLESRDDAHQWLRCGIHVGNRSPWLFAWYLGVGMDVAAALDRKWRRAARTDFLKLPGDDDLLAASVRWPEEHLPRFVPKQQKFLSPVPWDMPDTKREHHKAGACIGLRPDQIAKNLGWGKSLAARGAAETLRNALRLPWIEEHVSYARNFVDFPEWEV